MKKLIGIILLSSIGLISALAQDVPAPSFETYKPVFQTDVYILNDYVTYAHPLGLQAKVPVSPAYALSETSALELLVVLADQHPTLFHSGPFGWASSWGFATSRLVPWIKFPDGSCTNAGLIAWYFTHGFSQSYLKLNVQAEIDWMHKAALEGTGNYDKVFNYLGN